jgi:predicted dehydrogenase
MTGLGIHLVDAMIGLAGPVAEVVAHSQRRVLPIDLDDSTAVLFRFAGGASGYLGTLTATAALWRLQVFGSAGWSEMRGELCLLTSRMGQPQVEVRYPALDIERAELEAFAAAIAGEAPYPIPVSEAVHGVSVLETVVSSTRAGTWLPVP